AAEVLAGLAGAGAAALGPLDRLALEAGGVLAPKLPAVVLPAVRERVRTEMAGVILPAGRRRLAIHAAHRRRQGIRLNVNVLGEAILGEDEAERRTRRVLEVMDHPSVDYVSVKISSVSSQLDVLAFDQEVDRIAGRLRRLYDAAITYRPAKFVNLDMEEYRDLDLTLQVFKRLLDEDRYSAMGAGIVLQAYLPDSLAAMEDLCAWARARHERTGGWVKVRIVKGANLAMERVEAELRGWCSAPFAHKEETDANYKRMLDVALDPAYDGAVRVGAASHNLFEVAWATTLAADRGAGHRLEVEMLEGMAPAVALVTAERFGGLLLYAPLVERGEIESAIAYLVRRLDENSGPDNFLAHQWSMTAGSKSWEEEAARFRRSVGDRRSPPVPTRRTQDRTSETGRIAAGEGFANQPDTDFTRRANREWVAAHLAAWAPTESYGPVIAAEAGPAGAGAERVGRAGGSAGVDPSRQGGLAGVDPSRPGEPAYRWRPAGEEEVEAAIEAAREARSGWAATSPAKRRSILLGAAGALAAARGRLLAVMSHDTGKTIREGDPEVSEAVDFAAYYAEQIPAGGFRPHGTVVVASPWNFPLSIPAGGVLAALAAGNTVILKPAPEAVAVAAEMARALWEGGVPKAALQFLPCADGDASRLLMTHPGVDAVVLTGSWDTARMFLGWRPSLRLHAETSGKNAIVVTATADLDEAIADMVHSAFGHAGQKCSAASLAILESPVHDDPRFLPRLADAVRSLRCGPAWELTTTMGPLIRPPEGPLLQALTTLSAGEAWLVEPAPLDRHRHLWSPGVKVGVRPGSAFHLTECFGPVLGIMRAADLDEAIDLQNQPAYGLTAGLHALDPAEIETWRDRVEAGNLYVNRGITGAVVQRQPFGGWKRSVVGPGAKAGGPNYVASLGEWEAYRPGAGEEESPAPYERACREEWEGVRVPVDATGLAAESNAFRYRRLRKVLLCTGGGCSDGSVERALAAARAAGVAVETVGEDRLRERVAGGAKAAPGGRAPGANRGVDKVRFLGTVDERTRLAAIDAGLWVDDTPVAADPRREVLRWAREQAVSESRHRHGNVTGRRPGLAGWPPPAR
ncbi:MAG: proline dehydrogenase family protein, partial [Acidimicrobiales bacterium]